MSWQTVIYSNQTHEIKFIITISKNQLENQCCSLMKTFQIVKW